MKFPCRAAVVATPLLVLSGLTSVPTAQAHPLGNFSVNHYDGLRLSHDGIEDTADVDSAEIPTAQNEEATDTDHDGTIAPAEAADRAADRCARLAGRTRVSVDGRRIAWHVNRSTLTYGKGAAACPRRPADLHPAGGLGVAITLTAADLLLSGGGSRPAALSERHLPSLRRCTRYATVLTAVAVLTVGTSLTLRSLLTL